MTKTGFPHSDTKCVNCMMTRNVSALSRESTEIMIDKAALEITEKNVKEKHSELKKTETDKQTEKITKQLNIPKIQKHTIKIFGKHLYQPKTIPDKTSYISVTPLNFFYIVDQVVYVTGVLDYKKKIPTLIPKVLMGVTGSVRQIIANHKKMIFINEGKIYSSSNLSDPNLIKRVNDLQGVVQISCSENHYAALTSLGHVYLWGKNLKFEIGTERVVPNDRPSRIEEISTHTIVKVVCGNGYTACLNDNGKVIVVGSEMCWKSNQRFVDIVRFNDHLAGLTATGIVILEDGTIINSDNKITRISEGLGSLVSESSNKMYLLKELEWVYVDNMAKQEWSGCETSLVCFNSNKMSWMCGMIETFELYIEQLQVMKEVYIVKLIQIVNENNLDNDETKELKKNKLFKKEKKKERPSPPFKNGFCVIKSETFEVFEKLYKTSFKMYETLLRNYNSKQPFEHTEFYFYFFKKMSSKLISFADTFPRYTEMFNIITVMKSPLYNELESFGATLSEDVSTLLFNKHVDLLSMVLVPFKFLSKMYKNSTQLKNMNKACAQIIFEKFEEVLFRCNESLKLENIKSFEYVYSNPRTQELLVQLSSLEDLVIQLTRPNFREPKFRDIFLLMFRLFTTPECFLAYLLPQSNNKESFETKMQTLDVLKEWMECYPLDFLNIKSGEQSLLYYLKTMKEPYSAIQKVKDDVYHIFEKTKLQTKNEEYPPITYLNILRYEEFLLDPTKVTNTMTYVYRKLFLRITKVEFLYYLDKELKESAVNIKNMIDSFNYLSQMYSQMFNEAPKDKQLLILENTIKMLDIFLLNDRNYHAICGIVFAFIRIKEMDSFKNKLSLDLKNRLDFFESLCSFNNNYKNLRDTIGVDESPLLPFMGIISRDLVFASEYNASKEGDLFNFNKLRIMYNVVMNVINYQPNNVICSNNIDEKFHKKFCQFHGV
ncbi:hypothetical protein EIN_274810 [Entamoeba invadens IP1]|uniref:Guanine nucleotide exchange factor n=1 Tax=Entamoeba invadens IP1 TaxID=370355 RepID=A0A0A1U1H8_ENTIV|nr:hypothetical protein EIN_274810 [Entamoeba invadens IP1]ELP87894.1 hypothetical protein EIN_274810 [Entamoeba invadens IP1]|eukprot:XP_004254665.1 hypothetical protein EIN_274810 [Entamoeba invadens IP1]